MSIEQENNEMLRNQIREISHHSNEIKGIVNKRTRVEPWVVAKTERAATDLSDITHYLDGERYADGGNIEIKKMGSLNDDDVLIYELDVNQISPNFYHRLVGTIEKYDENEYWATYENELYEGDLSERIFKTFEQAESWVLGRINSEKERYIKEYGKMSDGGSMYADGGELEDVVVLKDRKYPITYTVKPSGNRWLVVSSSPNWEEDEEMTFVSKEDALNHAKIEAGYTKEFDPEAGFMRSTERFANGGETNTVKILKDSFHQRQDQPNRVYHSVEGIYGNYWFTARTDNSYKSGYGSNGINDGCVYQLDVWRGGNPIGRDSSTKGGHISEDFLAGYDNKWDYRPRSKEAKEVVSGIVKWLEKNMCDLKREWSNVKFNEGGQLEKGAINYLGDLWFAVQESRVEDYPKLAEALDRLHVSFRIQNAVSYDAQEMRGRRAISTEEAQQRIRKILSENGITKYAIGGGVSSENAEKIAKLEKVLGSTLVPDSVKEKARLEIERLRSEKIASNAITELTKRQTEYTQEIANRTGLRQSAIAEFVAKNGLTETETLNLVQGLGMGKLKPRDFQAGVLGVDNNDWEKQIVAFAKSGEGWKAEPAKQGDLNKKAIALVDKAKITDFKALVSEALTDANYHSEAFKFAQLVDSSIKTKEDWYKAEDFVGDEKTRDAAIQITNMAGWDGDKIFPALEFVLKMKGEHKLAKALGDAVKVEEASYPNAISELTPMQVETTKSIANATGLRQSAVADFVAKNGLNEKETMAIAIGLGRKQINPADVMTAVIGNPHNEFEKKVVEFAKSGEGWKAEPAKQREGKVELEEVVIEFAEGDNSNYDKFPKSYKSWKEASDAVKPIAKDAAKFEGYNKVGFTVRWDDGENYKGRLDVASKVDNPNIEPYIGNVFGVHIKEWMDYLLSDKAASSEDEKKEIREFFAKYDLGLDAKVEEPKSIQTAVEPETKPSIRTAVVEIEKEQPKVSDDRLKGKHISDVSQYVPHRNIESITFTIDGKKHTVKGSDIFDGIYVDNKAVGAKAKRTTKAKQPKVTRTQFEEEEFEFGKGGYTRPSMNIKTTGIYEFKSNAGLGYEFSVVGFEREGDNTDSLYFDDLEKTAKRELGSIIIKNSSWNNLSKGKSIIAQSSTGIKGKLRRMKGLYE